MDKEEELTEGCCYAAVTQKRSQGQAENTGSTPLAYHRFESQMAAGAKTAHYIMSLSTTILLVLYRRGRVLEAPLSPPNLRCHYASKERYRQDHRLTAEAHTGSSSRNPLELEVYDAEATSRSMHY